MGIDIDHVFQYHKPFGDQTERYGAIRATARSLAHVIVDATPASAEQTRAIRALQQAVMWANAAIAVNEHGTDDAPPAEVPAGAPSSPVSPEADRITEQEMRADAATPCARPGCGHARSQHGGDVLTCIESVPEGTPGRIANYYCGCAAFTLDPTAEAVK